MVSNVAIVFVGATRIGHRDLSYETIIKNIETHRKCFTDVGIDPDIFICTWNTLDKKDEELIHNPTNCVSMPCGTIEYKYDIEDLKLEISKIDISADKVHYILGDQPDIAKIARTRNNQHSAGLYTKYYKNICDYFITNNLSYDIVVRTRNDIHINIMNIDKYTYGDTIYSFPISFHPNLHAKIHDWYFIIPYKAFMRMANSIYPVDATSWDQEEWDYNNIEHISTGYHKKTIEPLDTLRVYLPKHIWSVRDGVRIREIV
jgi:hypothetical protein